ncbi:MAG: hypothetical protein WCS37_19780 [Chloroflexota bacterium]
MYHWTDISNDATECHEFFIRVGTRGVVLRPKTQDNYNAYIEVEETDKPWAEEVFSGLQEAKEWCESQLKEHSAPASGFYVFIHLPERDTELAKCFGRASGAFTRTEDALAWCHSTGKNPAKVRIYLMLDSVPERFYEPREAAGELRFDF